MTSILAFLFVLGVLVFVHELGHFLMARRIGVRVLTFSLGFGPKLVSVRRGDTEYCISAIPLGGYVKMAGETTEDTRTGAADEFLSKSKWQRFQVLVMGPVMNIVLAIVVLTLVFYQGVAVPEYYGRPVIVADFAPTSPAREAGVHVGDRIVSVGGKPVENWKQFQLMVSTRAGRPIRLVIDRGGTEVERDVTPVAIDRYETGDIGVFPHTQPQVIGVRRNEPAADAGLQSGDIVVKAGTEQDISRERLIELIRSYEGKPLPLQITRNGAMQSVTVVPRSIDGTVMIGATLGAARRTITPGLIEAFKLSLEENWESSSLIFELIGRLLTRDASAKQLMGPVAIASLSGEAAEQESWIPLFGLMAMISLNLGLLNLMPIPILDGGHIAILAIEGISRRDFSIKVKEKMLIGGFVLLLMLMVTVIYNDLMRIQWIEQLVPWR